MSKKFAAAAVFSARESRINPGGVNRYSLDGIIALLFYRKTAAGQRLMPDNIHTEKTEKPELVLASGSPYRRQLLEKLGMPFSCMAAGIDESAEPDESAETRVRRLAQEKAASVAKQLRHKPALVIGCDQLAVLGDSILGKPGNHGRAARQLAACSGKTVTFLTGLCLHHSQTDESHCIVEPFTVTFRQLGKAQIEHYLERDRPYDCAGSFKAESAGITLFEKMQGNDPNSLVGLPLIELCRLLRRFGIDPLGHQESSD